MGREMALVTGGLGGLGILAGRELCAAGSNFVVSTARSGRPGAMRPELMSILNATEANCVHYQVKSDVSDGTTMNDMLGQIVRIPVATNYLHIEDDGHAGLQKTDFRGHRKGVEPRASAACTTAREGE